MSTTAGLHVPVTPLSDVDGKAGTVAPLQNVALDPKLKVGVTFGSTVKVNVVGVEHKPAVGVNVYVPEFWLSAPAGLQVPVMPFDEVVGNVGAAPPAQIVAFAPKLNVGVIFGLMVTANVNVVAQRPAVGTNV